MPYLKYVLRIVKEVSEDSSARALQHELLGAFDIRREELRR